MNCVVLLGAAWCIAAEHIPVPYHVRAPVMPAGCGCIRLLGVRHVGLSISAMLMTSLSSVLLATSPHHNHRGVTRKIVAFGRSTVMALVVGHALIKVLSDVVLLAKVALHSTRSMRVPHTTGSLGKFLMSLVTTQRVNCWMLHCRNQYHDLSKLCSNLHPRVHSSPRMLGSPRRRRILIVPATTKTTSAQV